MRSTRFVKSPRARFYALSRVVLLAFLSFGLNGCYLTEQGIHFLGLNTKKKDIETLLRSGDLPEDVRRTLALVREIKRYSVERLGLDDDRNYSRYLDMGEKRYVVDLVSACEADRFEPYIWSYPFVGKMPYKGFYERKDAEREAGKLAAGGYDTAIWKVEAFSTLGFFSDPVYSYMKDYSVYELVSLIIHEQTHATLFIRNQTRFNEELATFVGDEGAIGFIRERCANEPGRMEEANAYRRGLESHLAAIRELHDRLDALYRGGEDRDAVLRKKREILDSFEEEYRARFGRSFENGGVELNNAYIMTVMTYTGDLSLFHELNDRLGGDLARTVEFLKGYAKRESGQAERRDSHERRGSKELRDFRRDPKETIRKYLAGSGS
jgi:predicted aminopeptidase